MGQFHFTVLTLVVPVGSLGIMACGDDMSSQASNASASDAAPDVKQDGSSPDASDAGVVPPSECTPKTCAQLGANCGTVPDGCGGKIACGTCADGQTCGGGGPNICGTATCVPKSCVQANAQCGWASDGCSEAIDCGGCDAPQTCGGGGDFNACGCMPQTCSQVGANCGTVLDGCDRTLDCGTCASGQVCGGGGPNVCGTSDCVPKTCSQLGASCGVVSDGCSDVLSCGDCEAPDVCGAEVANQCGCTCTLPNATTQCLNGECSLVACLSGFGDCDKNADNGCETKLQNNPNHCGSCNTKCDAPDATGECVAGECVTCSPSWSCSAWSTCGCNETQTRTCTDTNDCGTTAGKPAVSRSCDPCSGFQYFYCGASSQFPGGCLGTLYNCGTNGTTVGTTVCPYGCQVAAPGVDDYCKPAPICGEYLDACTPTSCCGGYACVQGHCCHGTGTKPMGETCGSGSECCSGRCVGNVCCGNDSGTGCSV